jgi:hypothetical protein
MDAETLARGIDRSMDYTRERGGCFTRDNLEGLYLGGCAISTMMKALEDP